MRIRRIAILAAFAAGFVAAPLSAPRAQYYYPPCAFPLAWPFCAAGAIVGTAATIVTAPFWLLSGAPPPYYGYYYPPPRYYGPAYYPPPPYYYGPR
jgi:uncharacterized membrane protein YbhN (UPF0104 family)